MANGNEADPFDTILGLEDQYYAEGHALGVTDGTQAGRSEGRLFGMQKGYEKFAALGALAAQAAMWESQIETASLTSTSRDRLRKHIATLSSLTDFESVDTNNTEDAVADFDDRLKRAESKAKVIASILGDQTSTQQSQTSQASKEARNSNMEDFTLPPQLSR